MRFVKGVNKKIFFCRTEARAAHGGLFTSTRVFGGRAVCGGLFHLSAFLAGAPSAADCFTCPRLFGRAVCGGLLDLSAPFGRAARGGLFNVSRVFGGILKI